MKILASVDSLPGAEPKMGDLLSSPLGYEEKPQ